MVIVVCTIGLHIRALSAKYNMCTAYFRFWAFRGRLKPIFYVAVGMQPACSVVCNLFYRSVALCAIYTEVLLRIRGINSSANCPRHAGVKSFCDAITRGIVDGSACKSLL